MYSLIRSILFRFNPERAHHIALGVLHFLCKLPFGGHLLKALYAPKLNQKTVFGLTFSNPVGIAAGFDKNADHVEVLSHLGFGFIEVGSVTARPCDGNERPRLFRLPLDRGIINRMGLNNRGAMAAVQKINKIERKTPLFVNIAKTPDPELEGARGVEDYCTSARIVRDVADVLVVNISCPNSGDGRTFEDPEALDALLAGIRSEIGQDGPPMVVKVSPDLSPEHLTQVVEISGRYDVAGFTATNTTISRDELKTSDQRLEEIGRGGLSGHPVHSRSVDTVRRLRAQTDLPIIGVGGIMGPAEARAFIEAGATLVQVYTGFVYQGPGIVKSVSSALKIDEPT
jgi:dihydroorotate dehydrogenase